MNELVTVLPGFQRLCFLELLLEVLALLVPKAEGEGDGECEKEGVVDV